jgi:chemotaxis protein CheX
MPTERKEATLMIKSLANELNSLTSKVWSSMANTCLELSKEKVSSEELMAHVVSSVQVVGVWTGAVSLDMDMKMARITTARLLGANEMDVSHEDIRDAAGELANMVGGGLKELLPKPCSLSLPYVVIGNQYTSFIGGGRIALECSFLADSGRLNVTIIEKESRFTKPSPHIC